MVQENTDAERVSSGIVGLDAILGGGLDANRLYLVEGMPGTGKTTLALQFLLEGVRCDERVLYVTLSESEDELRLVARRHGWSMAGVSIFELVPPEATQGADQEVTLFHPAELELGETTKMMLEKVANINPTRVVLDSLSELRLLAQSSLRYRRQILALKHFFAGRKCTVLVLDDLSSHPDDIQLHSIAHGVILLEQLALDYGAERRRLRVSKMRGIAYRGGYHDFTIKHGGLSIYPRLIAAEHHRPFQGEAVTSGSQELDALLGGGLHRGTSTLLIGGAGVGKSTVALSYAVAAAERGERALMFVFDEGLGTIFGRAEGLGIRLNDHVNAGRIVLKQIDPAEMSPGEFTAIVREGVEKQNAKLVIIDSLNGYLNAMPDEKFLTLQMHELLNYLDQLGVVTILVLAQHGLMGPMQTPLDISYLSDTVIILRYFEAEGLVRRAVSVVKKRTGSHERSIREFQLARGGVAVGPPLTQFRGIFTGTPNYTGEMKPLLSDPANAATS
jgi:circadian clock protein KaiC